MPEKEIHYASVIHKQELELTDEPTLELPDTAQILSIQNQNGKLCVWYQWYTHPANFNKNYTWKFRIIGTGNDFDARGLVFIATVQMPPFVWHIHKVVKS